MNLCLEQNGKKGKKNVSTNGNRIRADRSSLADARVRREEESKNRLRRISSLQPEEVDRVRKLSSHNSSKGKENAYIDLSYFTSLVRTNM